MLTAKERERYDRQIMIDEIGEEGQQKLKKAKVFVADADLIVDAMVMHLQYKKIINQEGLEL